MNEHSIRSLRILIDLQACQTAGSAKRGVGRYSSDLFNALSGISAPREVYGLLGSHHAIKPTLHATANNRLIYAPEPPDYTDTRSYEGGEQDQIDSELISTIASQCAPDVVHISHVFEGFHDRVALPTMPEPGIGQILSTTLYDLIPLRFPEYYFQNRRFKKWYLHRISLFHRADIILSISEASRSDAIELLGISPDKIVTIHGGISDKFKPTQDRNSTREELAARYNLQRRKTLLYTGGDDYRKNLEGALQAFKALPLNLRSTTQLVIICALENNRAKHFRSIAQSLGLTKDDVHFLGYIPEEDLIKFYASCDAFYFPSLYEGLGFPVIEAMACGAPVLCGDNSSLVELVDRPDARFDSSEPSSIAERLQILLSNASFESDLRNYGINRASLFKWETVARKALSAFDEALSRKRLSASTAAAARILPKRRMAFLTPLPPNRSGIADYNAEFLPYLSPHFDIDLYVSGTPCTHDGINSTFRIFDARDLPTTASQYDVIFYEFGNSEFHSHMLPLLEKHPGVVGLHDAFLSGLMAYQEFHIGEKNRLSAEMLYSHGSAARGLFAPVRQHTDANTAAVLNLPCTKRVLDQATGIISHSKFNLDLARQHYPQGFLAPYRIIPQMIRPGSKLLMRNRSACKRKLGFKESDFIIASFGHVAWNKCGDRIIKALEEIEAKKHKDWHLLFVGELSKDEYGKRIEELIRHSPARERLRITGFIPTSQYQEYISITDVAVQLRVKSRGGTPRGVLDCMAYSVPVVVNNEASYQDYPDDAVIKIDADPSPTDIATTLSLLFERIDLRRTIGSRGLKFIEQNHNPVRLASEYAGAIAEFQSARQTRSMHHVTTRLAPHLAALKDPTPAAQKIAAYLESTPKIHFQKRRLIIDCSHIANHDEGTGIPRVVRETVKAAYCSSRSGLEALAVERRGNQLIHATKLVDSLGLLLPFETKADNHSPIQFSPSDHLIMLDSSWAAYDQFAPIFTEARKARAPITTAVYDLLPITLPPGNIVAGGREWFEGWLRKAIKESDALVCISKSVADELIQFIEAKKLPHPGLKVGWWHLGSNIPTQLEPERRSPVRNPAITNYALMVGTIEPRKNHSLALDTFERLWAQGLDLKLAVAGKQGWMVDELMNRLRTHPQLNQRLFLFENATDADLYYLYRKSSMLLFVSKGEGFGLPLVEAAHHGTPIVCSKIPSFEEIAQHHAIYVDIRDAITLAADIASAWKKITAGTAPASNGVRSLTWSQSFDHLLSSVVDQNWQKIYE
jgi:glycosyltransferase involved in cell wall biosynthesis